MKITKNDRLADSCKHSNLNQMAAGSRSSHVFFYFLLNILGLSGVQALPLPVIFIIESNSNVTLWCPSIGILMFINSLLTRVYNICLLWTHAAIYIVSGSTDQSCTLSEWYVTMVFCLGAAKLPQAKWLLHGETITVYSQGYWLENWCVCYVVIGWVVMYSGS